MSLQRVTFRLTQLRCIAQSESGSGSEPYLWTTFFALIPAQQTSVDQPLVIDTPSYDAFRTEFPDGMKAGSVATVPAFVASASFDMELPSPLGFVGAIAVLMEEDSTPQDSIISGRIAYSKEIDKQLQLFAATRIRNVDFGPITDTEIKVIKDAVKSKVTSAIGRNQFNPFRDQDDNLGFMYKAFVKTEITTQSFDFPDSGAHTGDWFRLSGTLSVGPVPSPPIVRCANQRAALKAKQDQIANLEHFRQSLQSQLQHAPPQQKAAIVQNLKVNGDAIAAATAELPGLQAALNACLSRFNNHLPDPGGGVFQPG